MEVCTIKSTIEAVVLIIKKLPASILCVIKFKIVDKKIKVGKTKRFIMAQDKLILTPEIGIIQ